MVVWLGTDDAANVTGRQFVVGSNRVTLLSRQTLRVAQKDPMEGPFSVEEIGEVMMATQEAWPKPHKPLDV